MEPIILPNVVLENMVFCHLSLPELGICARVSKAWKGMVEKYKDMFNPPGSFGTKDWYFYFGCRLKNVPKCPINIIQHLPRLLKDHALVLIPNSVDSQPLTLKKMEEFVQKTLQGHATKYACCDTGEYRDEPFPSHWTLLMRTMIEGSHCSDDYDEERAILTAYNQKSGIAYIIPTVLDAAVCNFAEYVRTGKWLYGGNPWRAAWCQEKFDSNSHLLVGDGSESGLCIFKNIPTIVTGCVFGILKC